MYFFLHFSGMSLLEIPNSITALLSSNTKYANNYTTSPSRVLHQTYAETSDIVPNNVVSHSISDLSLPHTHTLEPPHHFTVTGNKHL